MARHVLNGDVIVEEPIPRSLCEFLAIAHLCGSGRTNDQHQSHNGERIRHVKQAWCERWHLVENTNS